LPTFARRNQEKGNVTIREIAITTIVPLGRTHKRSLGVPPKSMFELGLFTDFGQPLFPITFEREQVMARDKVI
jgi:hypothetical protein